MTSQQLHQYQSAQDLLADAKSGSFNVKAKSRLAPPTQRSQKGLLGVWLKYKSIIQEMEPTLCVEPTLPWLRRLFRSLAQRPGILDDRISIQSLIQYVGVYQGIFKREYRITLDPEEVDTLKEYIKFDLKVEFKLKSKERRKTTVRPEDFKDIVLFMWTEDTHKYREQRTQLQFHWLHLILFYSISRPGALVTPTDYVGSGQYLSYQDCELWLERDSEGGPAHVRLQITFRFRKNERDDDNGIKINLWENLETPSICPLKPFLAMAFRDGLFGRNDPAHLYRPLTRKMIQVKFEKSLLHLPVLRKPNSVEGLVYSSWSKGLKGIGFRMGYEFLPTSYSYRYHGANALSKKTNVAQLQIAMGHLDERPYNQNYQSKTVIDLQSIVMGQEPKDLARIGDSLSASRYQNAPHKLPSDLHKAVVNTEEVHKLTHLRDTALTGMRAKLTSQLTILKERLRTTALKNLRKDYIAAQEEFFWDDEPKLEEAQSNSEIEVTSLHPTRKTIVDLFYNEPPSASASVLLIREFITLMDLKWMDGKPSPPRNRTKPKQGMPQNTGTGLELMDVTEVPQTPSISELPAQTNMPGESQCNTSASKASQTPTPPSIRFQPSKVAKKRHNNKQKSRVRVIMTNNHEESQASSKSWCCPYRSCAYHEMYFTSVRQLREHLSTKHRILSTRKDPCNDEDCTSHRGSLRTAELMIMHDDLQTLLGHRIDYERCKIRLENWQPAEVTE